MMNQGQEEGLMEKRGQISSGGMRDEPKKKAGLSRIIDALYVRARKYLGHSKWIIIILALSAIVVEEFSKGIIFHAVIDAFHRRHTAIVLAVFPDTPTARPMADGLGFNDSRDPIDLKEGWRLEYMAESGTVEATDIALKKRLEDENVVLIVGHDNSSTVKALLNGVYGETGVPLILPAATNPDLTTVLQRSPTHILRLPPTDDRQVVALRQLLGSLAPSSVALIVDNSNLTYSNYIANQLIQTGGAVPFVDSVGIGLGDRGFSPGLFFNSDPELLVFIGMEVQADIFLRRLRHELGDSQPGQGRQQLRVPTLVFTDGVAGELFSDAAKGLLEKNARMYLTCPLPPLRPKGQMLGNFPTYRAYAFAARQIIDEMIAGIGSGKAGRAAIISQMKKMIDSKSGYEDFGGLKVKFDQQGNNLQEAVHVFEMTKAGVIHSLLCPCT